MLATNRRNRSRHHLALVTANPIAVGGMQTFTRFLVGAAANAGWRVSIPSSGLNIYDDLEHRYPGRILVMPTDWVDETLAGDRRFVTRVIRQRRRWFRSIRPSVAVFCQSSNTPWRSAILGARLAGVPVVSTHRTMPWIKEFVPPGRHCFGLLPGLGLHNKRHLFKTWLTAMLADRIVYNSQAVRQEYESVYHYPRRKGVVVPNATEVPTISSESESSGELVVGYVGRLSQEKRVDVLIRAFAASRTSSRTRLVLYGEGPERPSLEALASELGLGDRVAFKGETGDRWSAYEAMHVVVLCSRRESSSNMVLEAMAAGKAVITTDVGGMPELVGHGRSGICVPVGEVSKLAEALDRLISQDDERRLLGRLARGAASRRHDPGAVAERWLSLLAEVARGRHDAKVAWECDQITGRMLSAKA